MRSYPQNSPQAAARIIGLAMIADGGLCKKELDTFDQLNAHEEIGLDKQEFHTVLHTFCEDLLAAAHASSGDLCRVNPATLAGLMAEIDDPELRHSLIALCVALVQADGHVADSESMVLLNAVEHWGLAHEVLMSGDQHV